MKNIENDNIKRVEVPTNGSHGIGYQGQYTPKSDFQAKLIKKHITVGRYRVSWNSNNMPVKQLLYVDGRVGALEPITIEWDQERYPNGILDAIDKVKFKDSKGQWNTRYIFEGEKYNAEEFIKKMNREKDSKWFRFAIELIESIEIELKPLALYKDKDVII